MAAKDELFFPPFRLDLVNEKLFRGEQLLQIRPRNFAVLRQLVEQAGQVVRKEDLIKSIWGKYESEGALKQSIFQLREQLEDDAENPRFIETVPRGYRFIAEVKRWLPRAIPLPPNFVGRAKELEQLQHWAELAKRGERQMVFVTGEPGIGKTTLLDAIVAQLTADPTVWIGRGQGIEQYGEGEAYLPILEALGQIGRRAGSEQFSAFLGRYAPTWLAQLPTLIDEEKQEALQRRVQGATRQRMLRELVEAVEIFTSDETNAKPPLLVFVLEDLQWSDYSTLDLLSSLARRREPARLLILGTYRPAEGLAEGHPLRAVTQELQGHAQCKELALSPLDSEAVKNYIEQRFPASALPERFPQFLSQLTGGNPLFLATVVNDFIDRAVVVRADGRWVLQQNLDAVAAGAPENVRQLITRQIERLNPSERRFLEAASIAGLEFAAATVAEVTESDIATVEASCNTLAQRQHFLQVSGQKEWPNGASSSCYSFRHALYQYLWNERLSHNQRRGLHLRIGQCQEAAYGHRAAEIAAELAIHFEEGGDPRRALHYRRQAALNALQRSAYEEALTHLTRALPLTSSLPDEQERLQQEIALHASQGRVLMVTKGQGAPEVGQSYLRAQELCMRLGQSPQLFPIAFGLWGFHLLRSEYRDAQRMAEESLRLARQLQDDGLLVEGHAAVAITAFYRGELEHSNINFSQSMSFYDPTKHANHAQLYGQDPWIACRSWQSQTLWLLGYPDQAVQKNQEAITYAEKIGHPFSTAFALLGLGLVHQFRREAALAQHYAEALLTLSRQYGFPFWIPAATILQGWALVQQGHDREGAELLQEGILKRQGVGGRLPRPYHFALLAEAYGFLGDPRKGLAVLAQLDDPTLHSQELWWAAEQQRLKGVLRLQAGGQSPKQFVITEAEQYLLSAINTAQQQQARSLELRAALDLCRLWRRHKKLGQAQQFLQAIYERFTEGYETADLQEAARFLNQ